MRDPKLVGTIKLPTIEDAVKAGGFLAGRPEDIIEALKAVDIVRAQPRVEHLCQCNVNGVVSRQVVPQFPHPPQQVTADRICGTATLARMSVTLARLSLILWRRPRPRRRELQDPGKDRAVRLVRAGQIADAHQEFPDDLPPGEAEGPAKELRPRLPRAWVVRREPERE